MNKLVDLNHLDNFKFLLQTVKSRKSLIEYFDKYILEIEKQDTNELKRVIYRLMKCWQPIDENRSREYYCIYNNLKNGKIDTKTAIDKMNNMEK